MTEPPDNHDAAGGYAAQLEALRSVAKWLMAAFAGVGALLVAGLPISGIAKLGLSSWRLYLAIAAAALTLMAVGYMINQASEVLTHEWLTLASFGGDSVGATLADGSGSWFQAQLRDIDERLSLSRDELFGYAAKSRAELHQRLREVDELIQRLVPGSGEAWNAQRQAALLRQAARDTVQYANYCFTLKLFERMRLRLGVAAVVVAVGISVFAYSTDWRPDSAHSSGSLLQARVRTRSTFSSVSSIYRM